MHDETLLRKIVLSAGHLGPVPQGLSLSKIISDTPIGHVKIRAYDSEQSARDRANILDRLAGKVRYPELLGRWKQYLLFRYVALDPGETRSAEPELYRQLGRFLALLHSEEGHTDAGQLDREFSGWLRRLVQTSILPAKIAHRVQRFYVQTRPNALPVSLDYWDAMPHNFGWMNGTLVLLDEKHLRPSFVGVGLIKPLFLLATPEWKSLQGGYTSVRDLSHFDKYRSFLEFYYLVAALYFYALIGLADRVDLAVNLRFLDYRDQLIQRTTDGSWSQLALGELHLYASFPAHIPFLVRRRLSRWADRSSRRPGPGPD